MGHKLKSETTAKNMLNKLLSRSVFVAATSLLVAAGAKSHDPHFLDVKDLDVLQLLPAPPSAESQQQRAELQTVLAVQSGRTPADIDRAKAEVNLTVFAFDTVLGSKFNPGNCPKTATLFKGVEADAKAFSRIGKNHWNRRRPPFIDTAIKPVVLLEDEGAYPSSHSARAMAYAELLAEVIPSKREALLDRAREIGWDRVVAGVHFPSDVYAGETLGEAVARLLLAKPEFRARLEESRAELSTLSDAVAAAKSH